MENESARIGENQWLTSYGQGEANSEGKMCPGGAVGIRTPDPHNAIVVLYQLSYDPRTAFQNRKPITALARRDF